MYHADNKSKKESDDVTANDHDDDDDDDDDHHRAHHHVLFDRHDAVELYLASSSSRGRTAAGFRPNSKNPTGGGLDFDEFKEYVARVADRTVPFPLPVPIPARGEGEGEGEGEGDEDGQENEDEEDEEGVHPDRLAWRVKTLLSRVFETLAV